MKKVVLEKSDTHESGAYIDTDGTIHQYNNVDIGAAKDHVKLARDLYHHDNKSDLWHLGSVPYELIDKIRIENKLPNTQEGRDKAIKMVGNMLSNGQLNDFRIHGS